MTITHVRFETGLGPNDEIFTQVHVQAPNVAAEAQAPKPPLMTLELRDILERYNNPAQQGDVVRQIGTALWERLRANGDAENAFAPVLDTDTPGRAVRLSFHNLAADARDMPWEAIHAGGQHGYLCLEKRVPVLREFGRARSAVPLRHSPFERIKLLCLIGAKGDEGRAEWHALHKAIRTAQELPLEVLVLTSTPALRDQIEAAADPYLTAAPIPEGNAPLIARIASFAPHIAHFFCHGIAGPASYLQVADSSREHGDPGETYLTTADLQEALSGKVWVTMLSACSLADTGAPEGVVAGQATTSLAEALVRDGFPAVVGMRAPILPRFTADFAGSFMSSLLRVVTATLRAGGGELDLATCFADACRATLPSDQGPPLSVADRLRVWTVPSLSLRPGPLRLEPIGDAVRADVANLPDRSADVAHPDDASREEAIGELDALRPALEDRTRFSGHERTLILERIAELERLLRHVEDEDVEALNGDPDNADEGPAEDQQESDKGAAREGEF